MTMCTITLRAPEGMIPYLTEEDDRQVIARNAMLLYPYIKNLSISRGRAAEILGVRKTDLIEFYDSMGIPYLNQSEEELEADLTNLREVLGKTQLSSSKGGGIYG